jgi:hypothetical protein
LLVLALAAVGLVVGMSWWQASAFLHPHRQLPVESPADRGLAYEDVALSAPDGVLLRGWYPSSQHGAAVIFGHGLGAHCQLPPEKGGICYGKDENRPVR